MFACTKFKNMKTKSLSTICLMLFTTIASHAQDKTYPIKTTAKPEHLRNYSINEANGNINLLFVKKGKKNEVYTNYVFDKDLNLKTETEEEMDVEQVKKSTFWSEFFFGPAWTRMGDGIIQDSVLSVEPNVVGNLVLLNGYIGWETSKESYGWRFYQGFIVREKIAIRDDATGRRLFLVASQTDAPVGVYSTYKSVGNKSREVSSGDVLVVSCINTLGTKDPATGEKIFGANIKYLAQIYSAKTLGKTAETPFEFKYSYKKLYDQLATDGSNDMALIFAPTHGGVKPYFAPDKNEYEYIRIAKDTKIKERTKFISPYGRLNNLCIYNFADETIIMGTSKTGNESKYADFAAFQGKDDQLVIVRIKNGQDAVVKATAISSLAAPLISFSAKDAIKTTDNQVWITGQHFWKKGEDPIVWNNLYAFNIGTDGSIAKHLVLSQTEKASEKTASPSSLTQLNDGSLLWNAYEYSKKGNMYPKYAKINGGVLGPVVYPGNKQYVLNNAFPAYFAPDKKELIYFGNTEDKNEFWLHKATF